MKGWWRQPFPEALRRQREQFVQDLKDEVSQSIRPIITFDALSEYPSPEASGLCWETCSGGCPHCSVETSYPRFIESSTELHHSARDCTRGTVSGADGSFHGYEAS